MKLQGNRISRDWTVRHEGRTFYVNFTDSDTQTLALSNRDNWEVWEQTAEGREELDIYVFKNDSLETRKKARNNFEIMKKLIRFCIENWDSGFLQEVKGQLLEQKQALESP